MPGATRWTLSNWPAGPRCRCFIGTRREARKNERFGSLISSRQWPVWDETREVHEANGAGARVAANGRVQPHGAPLARVGPVTRRSKRGDTSQHLRSSSDALDDTPRLM